MKGIPMKTWEVCAILDNRKAVTRRAVKPHYRAGEAGFRVVTNKHTGKYVRIEIFDEWEDETRWLDDPYRPGDILYVRETWRKDVGRYMYKANYSDDEKFYRDGKEISIKWRPSIHMPHEAARIFLRVTDVRVERLNDISERSAQSEGASLPLSAQKDPEYTGGYYNAFAELWDSTIKKADRSLYGWEANPWVWVIEFERIERPKGA